MASFTLEMLNPVLIPERYLVDGFVHHTLGSYFFCTFTVTPVCNGSELNGRLSVFHKCRMKTIGICLTWKRKG
jgi:hypothetical protein